MKSKEYDIRAAVIKKLLCEGWKSSDIRIEIPLDANSSAGRADIVLLHDEYVGCVELKSGSDKFKEDALRKQCIPYKRAFDRVSVVADSVHQSENDRHWHCVDGIYFHKEGFIGGLTGMYFNDPKNPYEYSNLTENLTRRKSSVTSVVNMASVLWKSELHKIIDVRGNKEVYISEIRETWSLARLRPAVVAALRSRPLNSWEDKFWSTFNKDSVQESEK